MKFSIQKISLAPPIVFFFLTGCASINTSVGFNEDENEYFAEDLSAELINTKVATKTDAELDESDNENKTTNEIEAETGLVAEVKFLKVEEKYRETHTSSRGYWRAALLYLQTGNEDDARWALENALLLHPKSKIANELMYQLDVDAINALGSENFDYKVQYGDSLSKLSKLYLKDSLRFYLLAKYNDIPDPSRLVVGQVLQIPGVQPLAVTKIKSNVFASSNNQEISQEDEKLSDKNIVNNTVLEKKIVNVVKVDAKDEGIIIDASDENDELKLLADVKKIMNEKKYMAVISLVEKTNAVLEENTELTALLVMAYIYEAEKLIAKTEFSESKKLLNKAAEIEPDNTQVNMMLIDMSEIDGADLLYEKGMNAFSRNDLVNAYALISQALEIRPNHQNAITEKNKIEQILVQNYYKQALMAQRKHELDSAIEHWDALLMIDKNNDNAKLYRAKAISLKAKLKQFVSTE